MVKLLNYKIIIVVLVLVGGFAAPTVLAQEIIDTDQDELPDYEELSIHYTDPNKFDTDGDGFGDGQEVNGGYSPLVSIKKMYEVDTDKDGLNDWLELAFTTDLKRVDTDYDGVSDYEEVMRAKNPTDSNLSATTTRRIEVDLTIQKLKYIVDEKLVVTMPVSSGMPRTPTPTGNFQIYYKVATARYVGEDYDLPNVKWNMAFKKGGYFIHTAYWHNNFGKRTNSHGCINMREKDVALLYKYIDVGTQVKVIGKTPKNGVVVVAK